MEICSSINCCGCTVCSFVCKHNAIQIVLDEQGFVHPLVNNDLCIECGLCVKKCPINYRDNNSVTIKNHKVYAAFSKNKEILKTSSSGGIFSVLAKDVICRGGIVFGVRWDENLVAIHDYCDNNIDLIHFRGSKYVQSDVRDSYVKAKEFLNNGRVVLFSGTPCQIEALNLYLNQKYENLITVDVVCHGVPSPIVWKSYKEHIEKSMSASLKTMRFRVKYPSWNSSSCQFLNEKGDQKLISVYNDPYFAGFVRNTFLRPSCYVCRFSNINHPSDITLCDYWGYKPKSLKFINYYKTGISAIIVNSSQGNQIIDKIKEELILEKSDLKSVARGNHNLSAAQSACENTELFWNAFQDSTFNWDIYRDKYLKSKYVYNQRNAYIENKIKTPLRIILPNRFVQVIMNIKRKIRGV